MSKTELQLSSKFGFLGKIIMLSIICISLNGCAPKILLSKSIIKQYKLSNEDLLNLQYYINFGGEFERLVSSAEEVSKSHKVVYRGGQLFEVIKIRDDTPGVATRVEGDIIWISFEPGKSFAIRIEEDQCRFVAKKYIEYPMQTVILQKPVISYDGKEYTALWGPRIEFVNPMSQKQRKKERTLPGQRIKKRD